MSDSFREVTSVSWFGRIKRAVGGVIFGLILIVLMVIGLFWNEGRAVQTARSLAEGSGAVVSVGADSVDAANDGKLVHVSGPVTADSGLSDPDFGIAAQGLRLSRSVEMYQWKEESKSETTKKLGGGEETVTTYSYSKVWDDSQIDSSDFKKPDGHQNPSMAIHGRTFQIPEGKLVAFDLDTPVLDRIEGDKEYSLSSSQSAAIKAAYTGTKPLSIVDGKIYLGNDNTTPALGDYRIGYELAPLGVVSIVARQAGSRFEPYQTQAGDALLMVDTGNVPAEKMFADAVSANTLITWLLRGAGLLLLTIGFALFLSPIGVILDVIPFLGSMARMGTGIIAFVLAILVGTTTIAIAWFWYRPLLAVAILAAGVIAAVIVYRIGRSRKPAVPAATPTAGAAV
ncbi:TMEM43 family protein [Mesorhizobium neociceri]|uniref:TMEM43 family protein n=1 Tax=Mesorhizobium neociceri TaxID=1307853 RepID=A0A838B4Y8_9HYPH|nr:TMEM43 family protein [Mesorhizobium neociceri]MBA1140899.1 TMEM43 family protein [Mesorhizobium neociceri]